MVVTERAPLFHVGPLLPLVPYCTHIFGRSGWTGHATCVGTTVSASDSRDVWRRHSERNNGRGTCWTTSTPRSWSHVHIKDKYKRYILYRYEIVIYPSCLIPLQGPGKVVVHLLASASSLAVTIRCHLPSKHTGFSYKEVAKRSFLIRKFKPICAQDAKTTHFFAVHI